MQFKRIFKVLIILLPALLIHGCASNGFLMAQPKVTMFNEAGISKSPTDDIDIYYTKPPERKYEEIAQISVGDTDDNWSIKQIKIKAREIGADGAIIVGRVGSYGYGTGTGTSNGSFATVTGIGVGSGYGLVAVAIRYK